MPQIIVRYAWCRECQRVVAAVATSCDRATQAMEIGEWVLDELDVCGSPRPVTVQAHDAGCSIGKRER